MTFFVGYINNAVMTLPMYLNSHMRIVWQIKDIISMWFHALHIHFQCSNLIQTMTSINYFLNTQWPVRIDNRFYAKKTL
jgi:hypothetical protein